MALFDDYFDPDQFQDSGGLFGRLLSLHPELDFSAPDGSGNSQSPLGSAAVSTQTPPPSTASQVLPSASGPFVAPAAASDTAEHVATDSIASTPSAASTSDPQTAPVSPDIGARLSAGLQGWAQTPAGSPFAALANGITGFNTGQQANGASAASNASPAPGSAPTPDLGNRLGAAFQSWALTPVGSPFAALANGVTGFNTGQTSIAPAASTPQARQQTSDHDAASAALQNPQMPLAAISPIAPARRPPIPRRWPGNQS